MASEGRGCISKKFKRVNSFFDLGEITCIKLKKVQVGFMLSMIEEKDRIHHFFWNIVSFFYLASKINESALKTSVYLDIFFFSSKENKIIVFGSLTIEKKKSKKH